MSCILRVKRQKDADSAPYWQEFEVFPQKPDTVASTLAGLAARSPLTDVQGSVAAAVAFEKGCGEAKCGACAMVVNGRPALACKSFMRDLGDLVTLEPLSKFPVVKDLIVDRTAMHEDLKKMRAFLHERSDRRAKDAEALYQSARCILCGCCLEVCPNYKAGGDFVGAAAAVVVYRLMAQEGDDAHRREIEKAYREKYYASCGESLSCRTVCPAGIPVDEIIAKANSLCLFGK